MHGDARVVEDRARERGPLESNEIDIDAAGGKRPGVVLHASAVAQVGQRDDDGTHM